MPVVGFDLILLVDLLYPILVLQVHLPHLSLNLGFLHVQVH